MLPMPHRQTSEYRATQLVSSIKHKLSHAIKVVMDLDIWIYGYMDLDMDMEEEIETVLTNCNHMHVVSSWFFSS